jgi:protocatechuate 3,4-dioxygenase beta subunit
MGTDKANVDAGAIYPGTLGGLALSPDGEGVPDVKVSVMRANDVYAETVTDQNGSYLFENMRSGVVTLHFEAPEGWLFEEGQTGSLPITIPQGKRAEDVSITLYKETIVVGSVWLDENANGMQEAGEKPLVGAVVALQQHKSMDDEDGSIISLTGTDVNGKYRFEKLQPGFYSLRIVPPEYTYLYSGNALPSNTFILKDGDTIVYDAPAFLAGYIRGKVFEDSNNDGKFEEEDTPLTDVSLELLNGAGDVVAHAITDSDGNYLFNELPPLRCQIRVLAPEGYLFFESSDGDAVFNRDGFTAFIDFAMGDMKNNMNAALLRNSTIGDLVWLDLNGNGLQETSEPGVAGIHITLNKVVRGNLQNVAETRTDEKGRYRFDGIVPGDYQLSFVIDEYLPTKPFDGLIEISSKLPWTDKKTVNTETFSVYSGVDDLRMDAGLVTREMADSMGWVVSAEGLIQSP